MENQMSERLTKQCEESEQRSSHWYLTVPGGIHAYFHDFPRDFHDVPYVSHLHWIIIDYSLIPANIFLRITSA